jgi:hypothetical protein
LHFLDSKDVKKGKISTLMLGEILTKFDALYKQTVRQTYPKYYLRDTKENKSIRAQLEQTDVIETAAASYSVFIQPRYFDTGSLFEPERREEAIAGNIFKGFKDLLSTGNDDKIKNDYHPSTIQMYKNFAESIFKHDVKIDLKWGSFKSDKIFEEEIDVVKSNHIKVRVEQLEIESTDTLHVTGTLKAIDWFKYEVQFEDTDGNKYKCKVPEDMREKIPNELNILEVYDVVIERNSILQAIKSNERNIDTLVSMTKR